MKRVDTSALRRATVAAAIAVVLGTSHAPVHAQQHPPPLPPGVPMPAEPGDRQAVMVGSHRLHVPGDWSVSSLENGVVQLQRGSITAHLAARDTSAGTALEQLPRLMESWNPAQPLAPVDRATAGESAPPGATVVLAALPQQVERVGVIHGLFIVRIASGPTPEALILDVFAPGAADGARDWAALNEFAGVILEQVSSRRPW